MTNDSKPIEQEQAPEQEEAVRTEIVLDLNDAKRLYELYQNVEAADAHFQRCQSDSFRQHVQSVYKAANIRAAFERLETLIAE